MYRPSNFTIPYTFLLSLVTCLLAAVWCMPGVIALRTTATVVSLLVIGLHVAEWKPTFLQLPKSVYVWMVFISIYPFLFSENLTACLKIFRNQWFWTAIMPVIALAAGSMLSNNKHQPALFGLAFMFPILTQLSLGLREMLRTHSFPYNFWGLHLHHDYFGYTAMHAIAILGPCLVLSSRKSFRIAALVVIMMSVLSTILAASRAGLAFVLLTSLTTVTLSLWLKTSSKSRHKILFTGLPLAILFLSGVGVLAYRNDKTRWGELQMRLGEGFQGDALKIVGEGPQVHGDTARPLVARAAWALAKNHPWGINGSRQAYLMALKKVYPAPVNNLDHAHNGWLDTCLAIGYLGAGLYFLFLASFAVKGLSYLSSSCAEARMAAVSLVVLSVVWVLRGCFDSTFRDHMLQMQTFTLPFLFGFLVAVQRRNEAPAPFPSV